MMTDKYTVAFDLDGTLCQPIRRNHPEDIMEVEPYKHRIQILRTLHCEGFKIIIFTRREAVKNGRKLTIRWLQKHKVPYDQLITKKPHYDLFIDDRTENATTLKWGYTKIVRLMEKAEKNIIDTTFKEKK